MDKETLSNYGWIVVLVLILAVLLALASPFGTFVADAVKATTAGFFSVNQNAMGAAGIIIGDNKFANCEHTYESDVFVNCDTVGTITYTCSKCGDTYTETRETAKHTFDNNDDMTCNVCEEIFVEYAFDASDYDKKMGTTTESDSIVVIPATFKSGNVNYKVTSIASKAFYSCNLTKVVIPNSVVSIGSCAFQYCYNLVDVKIPDSVKQIDSGAFMCCYSLPEIEIPNGITQIHYQTFYECEALTTAIIPDSVTTIDTLAFGGSGLKSVRLPQSLTTIAGNAFGGTPIKEVLFADGVTIVGGFRNCTFTSITIPEGVKTIAYGAFEQCKSLKTVYIPKSVENIEFGAFHACDGLKKGGHVYYAGTEAEWQELISDMGANNFDLTSATIHYNHTGE